MCMRVQESSVENAESEDLLYANFNKLLILVRILKKVTEFKQVLYL